MAKLRPKQVKPVLKQFKLYHGGPKHLQGGKIKEDPKGAHAYGPGVYAAKTKLMPRAHMNMQPSGINRGNTKRTGAVHVINNRSRRFKDKGGDGGNMVARGSVKPVRVSEKLTPAGKEKWRLAQIRKMKTRAANKGRSTNKHPAA